MSDDRRGGEELRRVAEALRWSEAGVDNLTRNMGHARIRGHGVPDVCRTKTRGGIDSAHRTTLDNHRPERSGESAPYRQCVDTVALWRRLRPGDTTCRAYRPVTGICAVERRQHGSGQSR